MTAQAEPPPSTEGLTFLRRTVAVVLIALLALMLWKLTAVIVAIFAAILLAIALHGCASFLARRMSIRVGVALAAVLLLGIALGGVIAWFFGSMISDQFDELGRTLPKSISTVMEDLRGHAYGRFLIAHAKDINVADTTGRVAAFLAAAAAMVINGILYGILVATVGVYFAAQPQRYANGVVNLLPMEHRSVARDLIGKIAHILRRWLLGQFIVMLIVGTVSGFILWMLGIDAAIALGLISGLLTFIPYVGAVLAAVPATLIAFSQSPLHAGLVILMYFGIHFVEGDFVTPWVQAKATALPPALSVLSTVVCAVLIGPAGVLIAAPLTLVIITAIEVLYIQHDRPAQPT
jgi:predicted PurR-regulated permease PerM